VELKLRKEKEAVLISLDSIEENIGKMMGNC